MLKQIYGRVEVPGEQRDRFNERMHALLAEEARIKGLPLHALVARDPEIAAWAAEKARKELVRGECEWQAFTYGPSEVEKALEALLPFLWANRMRCGW